MSKIAAHPRINSAELYRKCATFLAADTAKTARRKSPGDREAPCNKVVSQWMSALKDLTDVSINSLSEAAMVGACLRVAIEECASPLQELTERDRIALRLCDFLAGASEAAPRETTSRPVRAPSAIEQIAASIAANEKIIENAGDDDTGDSIAGIAAGVRKGLLRQMASTVTTTERDAAAKARCYGAMLGDLVLHEDGRGLLAAIEAFVSAYL